MLVETQSPFRQGYAFVVYAPPSEGMPWLAVCIGPGGKVLGAQAFDCEADAQTNIAECAEEFAARFKGEKSLGVPDAGVQ